MKGPTHKAGHTLNLIFSILLNLSDGPALQLTLV